MLFLLKREFYGLQSRFALFLFVQTFIFLSVWDLMFATFSLILQLRTISLKKRALQLPDKSRQPNHLQRLQYLAVGLIHSGRIQ